MKKKFFFKIVTIIVVIFFAICVLDNSRKYNIVNEIEEKYGIQFTSARILEERKSDVGWYGEQQKFICVCSRELSTSFYYRDLGLEQKQRITEIEKSLNVKHSIDFNDIEGYKFFKFSKPAFGFEKTEDHIYVLFDLDKPLKTYVIEDLNVISK
ncbi:hypothetical protein [Neofamilia massiliensis]|uniref:hypothetical protein n=1 Tax=Neofamilia massiliensis TaxID=1673724 RepID=UPI0006BB5D94|nr:hypothetical protein [Neofamilia massiliensis]